MKAKQQIIEDYGAKFVEATELITFRDSAIHGMGAFAGKNITKGTRIIEYVGERIGKQESIKRCADNNEYIFSLNEHKDLDGNVEWNPARFINHSCEPNCEAEMQDEEIWVVAAKDVRIGEEITFNYGYDLEDFRDHACHCGAKGCVGYIVAEEFFESVRVRNSMRNDFPLTNLEGVHSKENRPTGQPTVGSNHQSIPPLEGDVE